jgi:hypothetical protein
MTVAIYLQFLILILALFYGTSVCSEEVEGKTLTYLTTRPVSKSALLLGKYAAYTSLIIILTSIGVILSFLVLNVNDLLDFSLYKILLRDVVVLSLGLMCYTAFFTFVGTIAYFQFWLGECDSVFSRLHSAFCHYSLSQVFAARSSNRTVFFPDVQVGAQLPSVFNIHDLPDHRCFPRFSLPSFFLERIYIRRLIRKGDRQLFLEKKDNPNFP